MFCKKTLRLQCSSKRENVTYADTKERGKRGLRNVSKGVTPSEGQVGDAGQDKGTDLARLSPPWTP